SADHYAGALQALWIVVWLSAIIPLIFIELSYAPMNTFHTIEVPRARRSLQAGFILAMTTSTVFLLNYVVAQYDNKIDLSYFKTTRPSDSSKKMVKNLATPFDVTLFFSTGNDVLAEVRAYFNELEKTSKLFHVKVVDQVLEPKLAKKLSVAQNGAVVFKRGKRNHQLILGEKLRRAKRKLKKLDSEFQNAFLKLSRKQKVAYLTVGHEERSRDPRDRRAGSSIRNLRTALTRLNYTIKDLGLAQGLGSDVPKDASVVIIAGPRKPFLPGEAQALQRYLKGGGRAMVFLDPEAGLSMENLLGPFGLKFTPQVLANARYHYRLTHTPADQAILITNRYGAHPSVRSLARYANKLGTLLIGAGSLREIPPVGGGAIRVTFTIHAMPSTWNDINNNKRFDSATEKRKTYEIAAAVTQKVNSPKPKKEKKKGRATLERRDTDEMRMLVVADSDLVSDRAFRNPGNQLLFTDAIKWLGGEERFIGAVSNEEDVRIVHTRKEDQLWFYLTIFAMPALVLAVGLFYTRRRRSKR
ncbi:MAG: Gldg family protein, partial [Deltaproteobacteria bacterium]|nr:Gldg family protein [Deltaproteobacteria bacterium]